MDAFPKIRDLHPIPTENGGKPAFLLRDPLQLNGHMLVIPRAIGPLLYLADGTRDLETITRILRFHFGLTIQQPELEAILQIFDEAFLLQNRRSLDAHAAALQAFREADFRLPASAGGSYPAEAAALHRLLQDQLEAVEVEPGPASLRGLLSPHIDYERGADTYARVWKRAAAALQDADLIVVIGTDHYGGQNQLTLTRQHYATPFGVLPTDRAVVDAIAEAIGPEKAFAGELFHRTEHSLELPLVWLHHLIGGRDVPVVPVLCGNLDLSDGLIERFAGALRAATAGRKPFVVVSGDLAHVGPAFGGEPLGAAEIAAIQASDQTLLAHLRSADPEAFLFDILKDENAHNVCGAYPLYLALRTFDFKQGEVNGYAHCPADDEGASIVSIGGVVFE